MSSSLRRRPSTWSVCYVGCSASDTARSISGSAPAGSVSLTGSGHDQHRAAIARQAWVEHRQVYGARRLTTELHERGHHWNRKAVARLMRLAGIEGAHRRRRGRGSRHCTRHQPRPDRAPQVAQRYAPKPPASPPATAGLRSPDPTSAPRAPARPSPRPGIPALHQSATPVRPHGDTPRPDGDCRG